MIEPPCRLQKEHDVSRFDCGKESPNQFLQKFAWQSQQSHGTVTYVVVQDSRVVGYYSVSYGSVLPDETAERVKRGMGKYPIPVFLLARLAVDKDWHRKGLGYSLLQDALLRAYKASKEAGLRAVVVDALDIDAKRFYLKHGFEPSPIDDMRLFLLMKDLEQTLGLP